VRLRLHVHTIRLDLDAPLKLAIDTMLKGALGIDDRDLGELVAVRVPVRHRADERLEVWADLLLAPTREEHETHAAAAVIGMSTLTGGRG